ncbi:hypothetical protein I551_8757 [Mycobacterium ulcerans str. Harvey]|uniref:Uncharacterized protein n=1 Tax=Mycobacterium ulcerans str. Harvey TaxID=1299332 RepID=A0ABN0RAW4_MYCUL|nr:hypothetical protein I551_8757 [Mycobacterium ulcerans str. Harvey]
MFPGMEIHQDNHVCNPGLGRSRDAHGLYRGALPRRRTSHRPGNAIIGQLRAFRDNTPSGTTAATQGSGVVD